MGKTTQYYLGILLSLVIVFVNIFSVSAQMQDFEATGSNSSNAEKLEKIEELADKPVKPQVAREEMPEEQINELNLQKQEKFMTRLESEFSLSKIDYQQLLKSISDTKSRLEMVGEDKITLQSQLNSIDDQITLTKDKLIKVIRQIVETENEITLLYDQIEMREVALNYQKEILKDYLKIIYEEENTFFSFEEDGQVSAIKMLFSDENIGTHLKQLKYFDLLNQTGLQMVERLNELSIDLKKDQMNLRKKKDKLLNLQNRIEKEKEQLEIQKEAKTKLMDLTLGQEKIYDQLLKQSIAEQEYLLNEIKSLSNAIRFIEKKMEEEGDNFDPERYLSVLDDKQKLIYNFTFNSPGTNLNGFVWPVDPDLGVSAYFRDPGYVGRFGVRHNAIDMPEYQGSPVRAAADGVVYTAKDNGYGYSYIILAHTDGFMTVYGHMTEILVEEGQIIDQGTIIGLSGGMPGTKGAGYMTTGPHLHFEMLLNGVHVDPLNYLPLDVLSEEHIQKLPVKYQDMWELEIMDSELLPRSI